MKKDVFVNKIRQNIQEFVGVLKDMVEICIEEEVTSVSSSIIDEIQKELEKISLTKRIDKFILVSFESEKTPFRVWDKIKERDEDYFKGNLLSLIEEKYRKYIIPYIELIDETDRNGELIFDDNYREVLWQYAESFVSLVLKYLHAARVPFLRKEDDTLHREYRNPDYLAEIPSRELKRAAEKFNVELEW